MSEGYLTGQLLIAMPTIEEGPFARSVVFLCEHSEKGAMGIVINKPLSDLSFADLLKQVGIEEPPKTRNVPMVFGGPVETARGFVLHSLDYRQESTVAVDDEVGLTATIDILTSIAQGQGPRHRLMALGYAGWAPGQLDAEIHANGWLNAPADLDILFESENDTKWERAVGKLGVDAAMLTGHSGRA